MSIGLALFALLALSSPARAAEFRHDKQDITVARGQLIKDDLYVAGGNIVVDGTVQGDLVAAGSTITVNGEVTGNVIAASSTVTINGTVDRNVRAAAGSVKIYGEVGHDLLAAGNELIIGPKGIVKHDVMLAVGNITIDGATGTIHAGLPTKSLQVSSTARINGDLVYRAQNQATIADGAIISGQTKFTQAQQHKSSRAAALFSVFGLLGTLTTFILTWLFLVIFPKKSQSLAEASKEHVGADLLTGFLATILTPIAILILCFTIIGLPAGILALLVYLIVVFIAKLISVLIIGRWVERWFHEGQFVALTWVTIVIGVVARDILWIVPLIGPLVVSLIWLFAVGSLLRFDYGLFKSLRKSKQL